MFFFLTILVFTRAWRLFGLNSSTKLDCDSITITYSGAKTPIGQSQHQSPSEVECKQTDALPINHVRVGDELAKKPGKNEVVEESYMNQAPVSSPGSSLSLDAKRDPGSSTGVSSGIINYVNL